MTPDPLMQFQEWQPASEEQKELIVEVRALCKELATKMDAMLPNNIEKSTFHRKFLEAKAILFS